jgi:hypothetical protein
MTVEIIGNAGLVQSFEFAFSLFLEKELEGINELINTKSRCRY